MLDTNVPSDDKHRFAYITKDQAKDTGMAIILLLFIFGYFFPERSAFMQMCAIIILVVDMVVPIVFKPAAWLWFGFARIMGSVMSKLLLTIVFIFLVTPVGIVRNLLGKDTLLLKRWKKDDLSVFLVRNHLFQSKDVEKPY
jgi:multisubunit Na+/H+ antiporter MnhG subunit